MGARLTILAFTALGVLAAVALAAVPAIAQEDHARQRTLAKHTYPATPRFEDPFLNSNVGIAFGAGKGIDVEVPLPDIDGEPRAIAEGDLAFLVLQLAYQQRITSWLNLGFSTDIAARLGTTNASLIAEGGTALYGPELNAKIKLVERKTWASSVKLGVYRRSLYDISPLDFAREVIDEGGVDSSVTLLTSSESWRLKAAISGVYTLSPRLGAKGYVETRPGERLREEDIFDSPWSAGVALSWDANPWEVPLGLVGSFVYRSESDLSSDVGNSGREAGLGIFYKARSELVLGLDLAFQTLDQTDSDQSTNALLGLLAMRYDF